MEVRRDIGYAIGSLLLAGLAVALVSIGLFSRMTPAIERIRKDNVVTLDAARELLKVFVESAGDPLDLSRRARAEAALATMRKNLTVEDEGALVLALTDAVSLAMEGGRTELGVLVVAVEALSAANTEAMVEADIEAQRLGEAGAWTASIGGIAILLLWLVARARLERRVIRPVLEVARVLDANRAGDTLARCRSLVGTVELERALRHVNKLLDRSLQDEKKPSSEVERQHAIALIALLEMRTGPWVVLSANGLVAANEAAHERLAEADGARIIERWRQHLHLGGEGMTELDQGRLVLCDLEVLTQRSTT